MTYTVTVNPTFNSLEIAFESKPSEQIREALKALRFRWHNQRRVWYGYKDEATVRAAIDGSEAEEAKSEAKPEPKAEAVNKFNVKVGDIFRATWGYEQTNNDFFQVVALVGESSVRVREVYLPCLESRGVSWASEDRKLQVVREILPAAESSVFIKDQERGDVKRLKSFASDGVSNPQFKLSSFCNAYHVSGDTIEVYESWYA
jgi:hypothetical protein